MPIAALPRNHTQTGNRIGTPGVDIEGVNEEALRASAIAEKIGLICRFEDVAF